PHVAHRQRHPVRPCLPRRPAQRLLAGGRAVIPADYPVHGASHGDPPCFWVSLPTCGASGRWDRADPPFGPGRSGPRRQGPAGRQGGSPAPVDMAEGAPPKDLAAPFFGGGEMGLGVSRPCLARAPVAGGSAGGARRAAPPPPPSSQAGRRTPPR